MPRVDEPQGPASTLSLTSFRALRYAPEESLEAVLAPPYDVIERDEALALAADEHNVIRLVLPQGEDPPGEAAATLRDWVEEGVLLRDGLPAVYVYEQAGDAGTILQRGLVGALTLTEPGSRAVLPHEDVMTGPVEDRTRLMRATGANLEPIWLLYRGDDGAASNLVSTVADGPGRPLAEAKTSDGTRHRLWAVTDREALDGLATDLAGRQALIADGHHRHAAYRRLQAEHRRDGAGEGPWDRGLALLVDLERHPPALAAIHRHLDAFAPSSAADAASRLPGLAVERMAGDDWRTALAGATAGTLLLVGSEGDRWQIRVTDRDRIDALVKAALVPAESSSGVPPASWRALDTVLLHYVLLPAWDVEEPDVSYHHDPSHAVERARAEGGTAVLMAPVDVADVFALAEQGVRMPRKSTSFGPKPRSGLVLRTFESDR
jgi:uncharacterized protein (DUF1015 family)